MSTADFSGHVALSQAIETDELKKYPFHVNIRSRISSGLGGRQWAARIFSGCFLMPSLLFRAWNSGFGTFSQRRILWVFSTANQL
jgi:hypothetical protein